MRPGWIWLASFAVYPIVGAPLLKHPVFRPFGLGARVVLAAGCGAVLVSLTMTTFALAGWQWGPLPVLASIALAVALRGLVRGLIPEGSDPSPAHDARGDSRREGRSGIWIAHAVTATSLLAALAATVAARSTSPDLLLFWGPKAQQFATVRTIDAAYLGAPNLEYLHTYYPPLVTNVFALGAMIAGRFPWGAATLTFPLFLTATAVALFGTLRTARAPAAAALATALTTSALALVGIHSSVAGNAEPFLLFFEITAIALLLTPAAGSGAVQLLAGCLLAGAASAKVEGLPFVLAVTVLFLLLERKRARPAGRSALFLIAPTLLSSGVWLAFGATRKIFYGYRGYGHVSEFHWDHAPAIFYAIGRALWQSGHALPFAIPLLVVALAGRPSRKALLPLGVAAGMAAFLLLTYLQSSSNPSLWISWSAARVFSPIAALLALAAWCSWDRRTASGPP
ncbi:MAG: hypothetical protein ABJC07_08760 [Acidobacteriota bacterium]